MLERLPVTIDPLRFALARRQLQGRLPLKGLDRLTSALESDEGEVAVELEFGIDTVQNVRYMRGRLRTEVQLQCQRCMGPLRYAIDTDLQLGIVGSEAEGERLPTEYDPLLYVGEPLHLAAIVEDELILNLPLVARHPAGECPAELLPAQEPDTAREDEEAENPFAVLAKLKPKEKS